MKKNVATDTCQKAGAECGKTQAKAPAPSKKEAKAGKKSSRGAKK